MSTRCQVIVSQEAINGWEARVTLYHHTDGYPSNMVPLIYKAYQFPTIKFEYVNGHFKEVAKQNSWEKGRSGKVASFLCAVDPGIFEPEESHDLHGDIEYLYQVFCVNSKQGTLADMPTWEVQVLVPNDGFWDDPKVENMTVLHNRQPIESLVKLIEEEEE